MPAGDRRKIDEVGNTVMYPLLPQQHGGENYYPKLLPRAVINRFQVCFCFHFTVNVSYKKCK